MFRHPAWAVGSYSSGPPAAKTVGTKSTGGCYRGDVSPCISGYAEMFTTVLTDGEQLRRGQPNGEPGSMLRRRGADRQQRPRSRL